MRPSEVEELRREFPLGFPGCAACPPGFTFASHATATFFHGCLAKEQPFFAHDWQHLPGQVWSYPLIWGQQRGGFYFKRLPRMTRPLRKLSPPCARTPALRPSHSSRPPGLSPSCLQPVPPWRQICSQLQCRLNFPGTRNQCGSASGGMVSTGRSWLGISTATSSRTCGR